MKNNSLFKKKKIVIGSDLKFNTFSCRVSENPTFSFFASFYYGADILKVPQDQRINIIHEKKKSFMKSISLLKFLEMDNGYLSLEKICNFLKLFHSNLPKYLTANETLPEEFEINMDHLNSLIEIIDTKQIYEILDESFIQECVLKLEDNFNGEQIQEVMTTVYTSLLLEKFENELFSHMEKTEIPFMEKDKIKTYLKKLQKTLRSFFLFLTEECLHNFIHSFTEDEFVSTEDLFYTFQYNSEYNIILLDEEYQLYGNISYEDFIDPEKPCKIIVCTKQGEYKPVFIEYNFKNGYSFFNKSIQNSPSEMEECYHQIIQKDISKNEIEFEQEAQHIKDAEIFYRQVKDYQNHCKNHSDVKLIERSYTKEMIKELHFHLPVEHDLVKFFLYK